MKSVQSLTLSLALFSYVAVSAFNVEAEEAVSAKTLESIAISESQDAASKLTYATILFYEGQRLYIMNPTSEVVLDKFKEVAELLEGTLTLIQSDSNLGRKALLGSQAAYLLGDLHFYVHKDPENAKGYYEKSLQYISDHDAAFQALERYKMMMNTQEGE